MVQASQLFRFGGTTGPTDKVLKYDDKTGTYFPVSTKNKDGTASASAGPFSVKASMSQESTFTWTPLAAELNVGSSFALNISTGLSTAPAGVAVDWTPALPEGTAILAGTLAALLAGPTLITGAVGLAGGEDKGKNATDMSAYLALVTTALALLAIQKNITFSMKLPLLLTVELNPLLVVSKEEGEEAQFAALDTKTDVFQWKNNISKTGAALGIVGNNGANSNANAGNIGANAQQNRLSGLDNSS